MGYYRGDYYRGDYYRGDPGIFGSIGKFIGGAAKVVGRLGIPIVSPLAGVAAGAIAKLQGSSAMAPFSGNPLPPDWSLRYVPPPGGVQGPPPGVQGPVGTMLQSGFLPGLCNMKGTRPNKSSYYKRIPGTLQGQLIPKGSVCVKTRRLNVANPRALRRALRRAQGFSKLARRFIVVSKKFKKKGRRR